MLFMSKQVSLPKSSSILQKMKIGENSIYSLQLLHLTLSWETNLSQVILSTILEFVRLSLIWDGGDWEKERDCPGQQKPISELSQASHCSRPGAGPAFRMKMSTRTRLKKEVKLR